MYATLLQEDGETLPTIQGIFSSRQQCISATGRQLMNSATYKQTGEVSIAHLNSFRSKGDKVNPQDVVILSTFTIPVCRFDSDKITFY